MPRAVFVLLAASIAGGGPKCPEVRNILARATHGLPPCTIAIRRPASKRRRDRPQAPAFSGELADAGNGALFVLVDLEAPRHLLELLVQSPEGTDADVGNSSGLPINVEAWIT